MSKFWKISLGVLFFVLIIEIIIFAPDTLDIRTPSYDSFDGFDVNDENLIQQKMMGFHLIELRNDIKEWEVWGKKAVTYKDDDSWVVTEVKVKFFGRKGDHYIVLGDEAKILTNKDISITGNIRILSQNGYKFSTDTLIYNSLQKQLSTDDPIEMLGPKVNERPNIEILGEGLKGDLNSSEIHILKDVNARKNYKKGPVKINSGQVQLSGINYMSKFINNVIIDSDTLRITGSVAGIGLSPNTSEISTILVEGNVKVSDSEKWATANQLEADFSKNKFIFKGSPRVVQNEDELTGDEIIFLDGGKKVKVLRARVRVNKDKLEK